ncbi:ABC-type sugar transport system, periplasmic component [Anopheles sinensis]|uniref:ABC-type sugar transport system, periplasmic component n=1 Tax=Anopheles sinensis TaxID=74873 RepID=A0A084VCM0_ANOSI|nr:ABC-type sugar transport system, periplasmic component [Anopheles sinensis]
MFYRKPVNVVMAYETAINKPAEACQMQTVGGEAFSVAGIDNFASGRGGFNCEGGEKKME